LQGIGLIKSANWTIFTNPELAVLLPQDVYALIDNYWGLSTPSALAINDSIYLFADVAQVINGEWIQVAPHQFKTLANSGVWYHDTISIPTMADFSWTNSAYLSNLLAPTPLLDDNGLLRIWYAGYNVADVNGIDTTYNVYFDSLGIMHVNPDYLGIGTSSYQFPNITNLSLVNNEDKFIFFPNPANQCIYLISKTNVKDITVNIYNVSSQKVLQQTFVNQSQIKIDIEELNQGFYFVELITNNSVSICKIVKQK